MNLIFLAAGALSLSVGERHKYLQHMMEEKTILHDDLDEDDMEWLM